MRGIRLLLLSVRASVWAGAGLLCAANTYASSSLIIIQKEGSAYQNAVAKMRRLNLRARLSGAYQRLDTVSFEGLSAASLEQRIRKYSSAGNTVDLIFIAVPSQGLLPSSRVVGLRAVSLLSPMGQVEAADWQRVGAQTVLALKNGSGLEGFFLSRFAKRIGEGATIATASREAQEWSGTAYQVLKPYFSDAQASASVAVVFGQDLAPLKGGDLKEPAARIVPHRAFQPASRRDGLSAFSGVTKQMITAILPDADLANRKIPTIEGFLDETGELAWAQLKDLFPSSQGVGLPGSGAIAENEIWLDGDTIRYLLSGVGSFGGDILKSIMRELEGARLSKTSHGLVLSVYFNRSFDLDFKPANQASSGQIHGMFISRTLRFRLGLRDGVLGFAALDMDPDQLYLKIMLPGVSTHVYLRDLIVDLYTGEARAGVGVLGNSVVAIAKAQFYAKKLEGIEIWESIRRNLELWGWPDFRFFNVW